MKYLILLILCPVFVFAETSLAPDEKDLAGKTYAWNTFKEKYPPYMGREYCKDLLTREFETILFRLEHYRDRAAFPNRKEFKYLDKAYHSSIEKVGYCKRYMELTKQGRLYDNKSIDVSVQEIKVVLMHLRISFNENDTKENLRFIKNVYDQRASSLIEHLKAFGGSV